MKKIILKSLTHRRVWDEMKPVILFSLVFFMCMAGIFAEITGAEEISLTAFDYPPYMDEALPEKGLFCELTRAAYQAVGYDASFEFYPLKRSTKAVIDGDALAQLGTEWNFSEDARKNAIQSVPLFYYRVVGFHLKDRFDKISFNTLKDLQGYTIGVIRGSSDAAILKKSSELNIQEVTTMAQVFKKVYSARNDIGFAVELSGLTYIEKHYPNERERWVMTEDAVQGILAQVVFSKKYPQSEKYISAFQEGVQRIRDNGTYLRIFEKYYGKGQVPSVSGDLAHEMYVIPEE